MKPVNVFISFLIVLVFVSCAVNPFSGNKTLALVPNSTLLPMAFQQYSHFKKENKTKLIKGTTAAERVKTIGRKIAHAAEVYLNANGYGSYLNNYRWEFNLVQNDAANAWALPGGKVMVYSGILKIANTDDMLAAIMGHEIAHALANHGQQRMSMAKLQQTGAAVGSVAFEENQKKFAIAYGLATQLGVMLPFSRKHESEADKIGLILMAIAGYNPQEAVTLWERMDARAGSTPPEILSTHPSNKSRIRHIQSLVDDARRIAARFR